MSRWKETLCGSVLLGQDSETPRLPDRSVLTDEKGMLHCGGVYFPQKMKSVIAPLPKKTGLTEVIMLPTSHYSVLIMKDGQAPTITTESPEQALMFENEEADLDLVEVEEEWHAKFKF